MVSTNQKGMPVVRSVAAPLMYITALQSVVVDGASWISVNHHHHRPLLQWWTKRTNCHPHADLRTAASPPAATGALSGWMDALTGGSNQEQLDPVPELPYGDPLLHHLASLPSSADETTTTATTTNTVLAIAERGISFTGEDFDVVALPSRVSVCRVRGALLHLPGKDQMRVVDSRTGRDCAKLDRKLVSVTPTYDIYRCVDNTKIGWLEKVPLALIGDAFEFHLEDAPKLGPFKPPAAYKLEGDFLDRRFVMKSDKGQTVATFTKDGFFPQWNDNSNHYQVKIAPGMDVGLVVACACAIDEEFDEEHRKRDEEQRKHNQGKGRGWFG